MHGFFLLITKTRDAFERTDSPRRCDRRFGKKRERERKKKEKGIKTRHIPKHAYTHARYPAERIAAEIQWKARGNARVKQRDMDASARESCACARVVLRGFVVAYTFILIRGYRKLGRHSNSIEYPRGAAAAVAAAAAAAVAEENGLPEPAATCSFLIQNNVREAQVSPRYLVPEKREARAR